MRGSLSRRGFVALHLLSRCHCRPALVQYLLCIGPSPGQGREPSGVNMASPVNRKLSQKGIHSAGTMSARDQPLPERRARQTLEPGQGKSPGQDRRHHASSAPARRTGQTAQPARARTAAVIPAVAAVGGAAVADARPVTVAAVVVAAATGGGWWRRRGRDRGSSGRDRPGQHRGWR